MSAGDVYTRFVQPGRVALVTYGPEQGKLCVVVAIITETRVLVDGPTTGVRRQPIPVRFLKLTDVVIDDVPHNCSPADLKKALGACPVEKYYATEEGKKHKARTFVENLDDFGRWRLRRALRNRVEAAKKIVVA